MNQWFLDTDHDWPLIFNAHQSFGYCHYQCGKGAKSISCYKSHNPTMVYNHQWSKTEIFYNHSAFQCNGKLVITLVLWTEFLLHNDAICVCCQTQRKYWLNFRWNIEEHPILDSLLNKKDSITNAAKQFWHQKLYLPYF